MAAIRGSGAGEPFPVASGGSGQARATGEQIARAVALTRLTVMPPTVGTGREPANWFSRRRFRVADPGKRGGE